jgi:NTE family protein
MPPSKPSIRPSRTSRSRRSLTPEGRGIAPLAPGVEPRAVVVLSGGAPNGAMVAAALSALYKHGKTFNTIFSSGGGALMGMLYAAPKLPFLDKDDSVPTDASVVALRHTLAAGISDAIYRWVPIGYKTFLKSGPLTEWWMLAAQGFKLPAPELGKGGAAGRSLRLYNDLVDLWAAATCPTDVTPFSRGICEPFPFLKSFVDFDRLNDKRRGLKFYMNTYCIETSSMEEFGPGEITEDHFDAALSYPFIYQPTQIVDENGVTRHYFEGGCADPLNLEALADQIEAGTIVTRTVVIIDVLASIEAALVRVPQSLWDAFGISIMMPVVSLARKSQTIFDMRLHRWNASHGPEDWIETVKLAFEVPPGAKPVTDWSNSNMELCWDIGWAAGERFLAERNAAGRLPDRQPGSADPVQWTRKHAAATAAGGRTNRRASATRTRAPR